MTRHRVHVWRTKDMEATVRPWRWSCACQRWRIWLWEFHWSQPEALQRACAHLAAQR